VNPNGAYGQEERHQLLKLVLHQGRCSIFKEENIMAMVVQHNLTAMNANRQLGVTTSGQSKSSEKLSSGYRINRAGDDAAGLKISEKMRSQVRGLNKASSNAQDGVSLIQTAEGALNETHSILQRMNELAVQGSNDTNQNIDRDAIQQELDALTEEIDRIASTTQFNKQGLLDGSFTGKNLQVGANSRQRITINIAKMNASAIGLDKGYIAKTSGYFATNDVTKTGKFGTSTAVRASIANRAGCAFKSNNYEHVSGDLFISPTGQKVTSVVLKASVMSIAGRDAQVFAVCGTSAKSFSGGPDVSDYAHANATIDMVAKAINNVSSQRSALGALQNRLEHTIANLDNVAENTQSAESRIRDTDMASEMVEYSKNNILAQAGQSMLAQANQSTQGVLSLLG
jgi:flagellin